MAGQARLIASRHPGPPEALAARLGARVRAGTPSAAARFGDVVLVSVPCGALPQLGKDLAPLLAGKGVLETGNPFPGRDGAMAAPARALGTGMASAQFLPGVRRLRVFSSIPHHALQSEAHRPEPRVGVPLGGDDPDGLAPTRRWWWRPVSSRWWWWRAGSGPRIRCGVASIHPRPGLAPLGRASQDRISARSITV
ncbi:MAG: NAD(P)-binding domain-containing protein [Rhodocyclaceae bacterium]|nr:NAD(P)-binding domain-containing protein [Rhodocyclaceae bacterium]